MSNLCRILTRIFKYLDLQITKYIIGSALSAVELLIVFVTPYFYKQIIYIVTKNNGNDSIYTAIVILGVLILLTPFVVLGNYLKQYAITVCTANLRKELFNHILHLPVTEAMERKTGDYFQRLSGDVWMTTNFLNNYSSNAILKFFVYTFLSIFLLMRISTLLAIVGIALGLLTVIFSNVMKPTVRRMEELARQSCGAVASQFIETLRNLPIIKVFLLQSYLSQIMRQSVDDIFIKRVRYRTINGIMYSFVYLFTKTAQPIGFMLGILFLSNGPLQIAEIVYAAGLIAVLADGMNNLNSFIVSIQPVIVASKRVFDLLDEPIEKERKSAVEIDTCNPIAIRFENVSFSYNKRRKVFHNISFSVERGKTVAIVGSSGSGKTTIMKLLLDFYPIDEGTIYLFGCPLENMSQKDIRHLCAYVPQEATVFDGTIADNIAAGCETATIEETVNAANKAHICEIVKNLPQGYNTLIGERGSQISGGQRQCIAIARAILKNTPILLLDEATAALDSETEQKIYQDLTSRMQECTTIIIAHRLSTVKCADSILVLENGEIVECGHHEELIKKGGKYWKLYGLLKD